MTNIYGDGEGHTRDRFLGLLLIKVDGVPLRDEMANVATERLLLLLRLDEDYLYPFGYLYQGDVPEDKGVQ